MISTEGDIDMAKYCYNCGKTTRNLKLCESCGTDTRPPGDVYFTQDECGDCNEALPRWANYCPKCGRGFGHYDPTDPLNKQKHNRGQTVAGAAWTLIFLVVAAVLGWQEVVPIKYAFGGAFILSFFTWLIVISRWERGRFRDGTIVGHSTEKIIRRERRTDVERREYYDIPVVVYRTTIRWDDGKEENISKDDCAADHIQLKVGDRIRYLEATRAYCKL